MMLRKLSFSFDGFVRMVGVATLALALCFLGSPPVGAQEDVEVDGARVGGATRFETAANIATQAFEDAEVAHVVFGGNFPDALAAAYAAGSAGGPILLTATSWVPRPTWDALDELDVRRVVLVGGTAVISSQVENALSAAGYDTTRISGTTRYDTAASVALTYGQDADAVGLLDGQRTALLASGAGFADALAVGPLAVRHHFPLLLTPRAAPSAEVDDALEQLDIEQIVVVGGSAAVSPAVVQHYQGLGYEVERWSGQTRAWTAVVVADNARERLDFGVATPTLARGDAFPDALAASVLAGTSASPVLLSTHPTSLGTASRGWFADRCPDVEVINAVGGSAAVSNDVLRDAIAAAEACGDPGLIGVPSIESRADRFPDGGGSAYLSKVRAAARDASDRVVLEFEAGGTPPGWSAHWIDQPFEDPTGDPVEVAGNAYLEVAMQFASGFDLTGPDVRVTYNGPRRIRVNGGNVVEVVETGDFEGVLTWVIGMERRAPFAIDFEEDPLRLVIDVLED